MAMESAKLHILYGNKTLYINAFSITFDVTNVKTILFRPLSFTNGVITQNKFDFANVIYLPTKVNFLLLGN